MRREYQTKSRTLMMNYLKEHKDQQFSAADVYTFLMEKECKINLATVYRNLDKLSLEGILLKYKTADNSSCMYQYADEAHNCHGHLHLQCKECGKIIHLECDFMNEIVHHLLEEHGFEISCEGSIIMGLCKECR